MYNGPLKILISAYACSPFHGSESGMGWNFITGLSKYHKIHVITNGSASKGYIEKYFKENQYLPNLTFHYIPRKPHETLRRIWPPSYYWYYKIWQKKVYNLALALDYNEDFDIIHQLNMVGYREPGYLWKISKPFVWGPIGGLENSPWRFLPSLGLKGMIYYTGRNLVNTWQRNFNKRPKKAINHKNGANLAATPAIAKLIKELWSKDSTLMCEVGQEKTITSLSSKRVCGEPLKIIWSGTHTPGKNLPLLLKALENIEIPYELHILGNGKMTEKWVKLAKKLAISSHCKWHGWLERTKAIEVMKGGHVFCITSISDLTSTVILEALSCGLPIVCLDHCGFAHVVTEHCGIKIPVDTPKKAANILNLALKKLYNDERHRQKLSRGAFERAKDFNWDKKIKKLNDIYFALLKK